MFILCRTSTTKVMQFGVDTIGSAHIEPEDGGGPQEALLLAGETSMHVLRARTYEAPLRIRHSPTVMQSIQQVRSVGFHSGSPKTLTSNSSVIHLSSSQSIISYCCSQDGMPKPGETQTCEAGSTVSFGILFKLPLNALHAAGPTQHAG